MIELNRPYLLLGLLITMLGFNGVSAQEFPQASSAAELRLAMGSVYDVTELDAEPHWTIAGEWLLTCSRPVAVTECAIGNVRFDLVLTMVRPDGSESHTHSFNGFTATGVSLIGDDLLIDGIIIGTGAVGGPTDIAITLGDVAGSGEFFFELPANAHLVGPIGGLIWKSHSRSNRPQ